MKKGYKIRQFGMFMMHHFLRVIWANLFGLIMHIVYLFKVRINKDLWDQYKSNQAKWNAVYSDEDLAEFIKNDYEYKWDGYKGAFDHNNFSLEFFTEFGDCDDVGHYVCKKLKQIYGNELEYCKTRGYAELKSSPPMWHYDCVYKFKGDDKYILFNYGRMNKGDSIDDLDKTMTNIYSKSYRFKEGVISWPCFWM